MCEHAKHARKMDKLALTTLEVFLDAILGVIVMDSFIMECAIRTPASARNVPVDILARNFRQGVRPDILVTTIAVRVVVVL